MSRRSTDVSFVVNNAGGGASGPAMKATKDDVERTFAINVFASLYMMQAVVPVMTRGGRVINISSIASKMGMAPIPLYSASKAAMDALTFATATELGRGCGITVNTIAPGPIPTGTLPLFTHPEIEPRDKTDLATWQMVCPTIQQLKRYTTSSYR